jgi:hypothetical protein
MPRLKFKTIYQGHMPTRSEVREFLGDRLLKRTRKPIKNDSEAPEGFTDYDMLDADHASATLVSSLTETGLHMPAIDIDRECMLVPSSKPGHFHLLINVRMTEKEYMKLLKVMTKVGIVQRGFWQYSAKRRQSFVRYPGVTKDNEQARIDEHAEDPF